MTYYPADTEIQHTPRTVKIDGVNTPLNDPNLASVGDLGGAMFFFAIVFFLIHHTPVSGHFAILHGVLI